MNCQYRMRKQSGNGCKFITVNQYCGCDEAPYRSCWESMKKNPRWSASSLKTFNACPYEFWLSSVGGWSERVKGQALYEGTLFGNVIQAYLGTLDKVKAEVDIMADNSVDQVPKLKILGWLDAMEVTAETAVKAEVEVPFNMVMNISGVDTKFTGYYDVKLDKLDSFGFRLIENKYSGVPENYSWFGNRLQYLLYLLSSGESFMGARIYKKPALRIKKGESTRDFRNRVKGTILSDWEGYFCPPNGYEKEINLRDYDVDEFKFEVNNSNRELKWCLGHGFYRRYNCKRGYVCNFYAHCSGCGSDKDLVNDDRYINSKVDKLFGR